MIPQVSLPDGTKVPALGQGTWHMGEARGKAAAEESALRQGIDLGMTLVDTAEMYGEGGAELIVGQAIAGQRDNVFVVTKVYPHKASLADVPKACVASLRRLGTDRIDLYLLHWRGNHPLSETIAAFERLREAGHIRYWGVSNCDANDMTEITDIPAGGACATNQVLYNPEHRGIEFDLLPWCRAHRMPIMAYSPLGQGGRLLKSPVLTMVAARHNATPAQIALAWSLRDGNTISIPKSKDPARVKENAAAADIVLTADDITQIDAAFPPPKRKQALGML